MILKKGDIVLVEFPFTDLSLGNLYIQQLNSVMIKAFQIK